ncbi:MAG: trans-aconitate 2-methyltransferase [Syntrophobacteraceae bacterium]
MTSPNDTTPTALAKVADLYSRNLNKYGMTPMSTGWRDEAGQQLRFKKLAQIIMPEDIRDGFSVNDFGCGYGAMFNYLDERFPGAIVSYKGYDISSEMIAAARSRFSKEARATFIESAGIDGVADYSFVSGTFNVRIGSTESEWSNYINKCLVELFSKSSKGLAFNLLTSYVEWKDDNLFYADPSVYFAFCKANLSKYISILHDYPLYEWTMLIYRGAPA